MDILWTAFLLGIFRVAHSFSFDNSIKWVSSTESSTIEFHPEPVGQEGAIKLFLCQIRLYKRRLQWDVITGKLFAANGRIDCIVPYKGRERSDTTYKLLYSYPGAVEWKPYTGSLNSENVPAGQLGSQKMYICRTNVRGQLLPGYIGAGEGICRVPISDFEHKSSTDIEVLSRSMLGKALGTNIIG